MDLTKHFPRGPRERAAGMAMLPRTIDKARAAIAGTLGEYIFDCPMDRQLFETIGIAGDPFLDIVRECQSDDDVIARLRRRRPLPTGDVLAAHNTAIDAWKPTSDAGLARFEAARERVAPGRTDIATWTDLIDVEEGRAAAARA